MSAFGAKRTFENVGLSVGTPLGDKPKLIQFPGPIAAMWVLSSPPHGQPTTISGGAFGADGSYSIERPP